MILEASNHTENRLAGTDFGEDHHDVAPILTAFGTSNERRLRRLVNCFT